jgi:hypothetical protein
MRGDLPYRARVSGTAQLFHDLAAARIEERGDVIPSQSYNGSPHAGSGDSREKRSATRQ